MEVIGAASRADDIPGLTRPVVEGDEVAFGDATLRVLETPGHIDGHVSFAASGAVFCGDTLFAGGCGYLFDGPPIAMFQSLHRLAALPERTRVCCAHEYTEDNLRFAWMVEAGNDALARRIQTVWALRAKGACTVPSTMAEERATNPFLRASSPALRAELQRRALVTPEATDAEVFAATRALKDRGEHKDIPDGALPL